MSSYRETLWALSIYHISAWIFWEGLKEEVFKGDSGGLRNRLGLHIQLHSGGVAVGVEVE